MALPDRTVEQGGSVEAPIRVYPMGFVPDIKARLIKDAQQSLGLLQRLSGIGLQLVNATKDLVLEEDEPLNNFFDTINALNEEVEKGAQVGQEELDFITHALRTEEELAVIFAKVSRNPGSFEDIARTVTEEGAAQFHGKWTVSIEGYGHASVAEHAILHMAIENTPSLDGDEITDNRLGSYTEFSARFKGRQEVGYFTPESVKKDPILRQKWEEAHQFLFDTHDTLMVRGKVYIEGDEAKAKHPQRRVNTKTVADQFKNLMPASRLTSIAVTMNAREGENAIRKLLSSPHASVRTLGQMFKQQALTVSPTLVKYADRNEYVVATREGIGAEVQAGRFQGYIPEIHENSQLVKLIDYDPEADNKIIAAAFYSMSKAGNFEDLMNASKNLSLNQRSQVINVLLGNLGKWDIPIRALEFAGDYIAEYPGMTYGDWREYKRHRMQSYQAKELNVKWGYMIPPLAYELDESSDSQFHGSVDAIKKAIGGIDDLFNEVSKIDPYAAQYLVTRLHYRPAVAKFNIREAYHLIKLRTGPTAHPFIRRLMWPLFDQLNNVHPLLMRHLRLKIEAEGRPDRNFQWTY